MRLVAVDLTAPLGLNAYRLRIAIHQMATAAGSSAAINAAALACGVSRAHFSRQFKVTTGITPKQWHLEWRLAKAACLLETTGMPLADIADHCGFADQSHFTNIYSRHRGMSPGAWRRNVGREA